MIDTHAPDTFLFGEILAADTEVNVIGHEIGHCLGLRHTDYNAAKANDKGIPLMPDDHPITESCYAANSVVDDFAILG